MIRQSFPASARAVGDRKVRVRMRMATNELGRDNMIVEPDGIVLRDFRRNPIILRDHNPASR